MKTFSNFKTYLKTEDIYEKTLEHAYEKTQM